MHDARKTYEYYKVLIVKVFGVMNNGIISKIILNQVCVLNKDSIVETLYSENTKYIENTFIDIMEKYNNDIYTGLYHMYITGVYTENSYLFKVECDKVGDLNVELDLNKLLNEN